MNAAFQDQAVLRLDGLTVHYETRPDTTVAVNDLSFSVARGETLGLVGESGCGKSTTAMAILRLLHPPGRVVKGHVYLNGTDLLALDPAQHRAFRWKGISLIPQGAMNALNPVMRIEKQMADAITTHERPQSRRSLRERIDHLLSMVGLPPHVRRLYPHELSGGMKQRVCIAMAVALNPPVVIADEPTSALDVVVQRIVAQSLLKIKRELGNAMILIGHDMGLMAQLADRVAVMYAGNLVEIAPVKSLFAQPRHPYTRQLIDSVPTIQERKPLRVVKGGPPDLRRLPPGCAFCDRCPEARVECRSDRPALRECAPGHWFACMQHTSREEAPHD
jgi:oligopeptide/dipeptide ABC transporter ATP-binding protein